MEEQLPLLAEETEDRTEGPDRRTSRPQRRRGAARSAARRRQAAWHLDAETRRIGLEGVATARATLRAAREARNAQRAA